MFEEEIKDKILKYIKNISVSSEQNYEIEFKFFYQNDMSYSIYNKLLDFYSAMNLNNKIEIIKETSIDILYKEYRFSIIGIDELNEVLNKNTYKQNNVLLKYFINKIQNSNSNNYIAIKKIKKEYININDYNILFKKAYEVILSFDELNIIKNDNINNNDIQFRYKDRIKLVIENEKNYTLQLDLTNVRLLQNYMDITTLYNKKKTYQNNVFPFPYIIFGYRCNIDMINNLRPMQDNKEDRLFFAGQLLTHIDNIYGEYRDRKITILNLQNILPNGFLHIGNYEYDEYKLH